MANRRHSNRIWFVMLGMFVAVFLFTFLAQKFKNDNEAGAANMAAFDPGYIISDYQMSNYNSMNEAQIQGFLNAKGRCGNTNFNGVGTRVGHFSDSTPPTTWHVVNGHTVCLAEENMNGESAAHIIWQAAQDYRINPQVLIVLLQKETGLITDPIPNSWDYQRATGYGCPDTAACSSKYYGFKNQVRNAAWLFRYTLDNGYSKYPIGNVYVQWNPNAGCGGSVVNIKNNATAALYRYTPYQPNAAALSSSYGYGDGCSAYGNRNFYSYFEDWFGSITWSERAPVEAASKGRIVQDGTYQLVPKKDLNKALDINGGVRAGMSSGVLSLYNRKTVAMENQLFNIKYDERNGYYSIVNPVAGIAFDVSGGGRTNNASVIGWNQNDGCNQDWVLDVDKEGFFTIISRCSSKVLDITSSNNLIIFDDYGNSNQKWALVKVAESRGKTIQDGLYQLSPSSNENKAIDIKGGVFPGMKSGETLIYDKMAGKNNQLFELHYNNSTGYYSIVNPVAGLALDISGAGFYDGASAIVWSSNGGCNQDWVIEQADDGTYKIISRCSSKVLDATFDGRLIIYSGHDGMNQKWKLERVGKSTVEDGVYQLVSKSSGRAIDIKGGAYKGMLSGELITYEKKNNNKENQLFNITYNKESDYYSIVNPVSGLSLDVMGALINNDTPVIMWSRNSGCNQGWIIEKDSGDYYKIVSKCSDRVVDDTAMGKVVIYDDHSGANQRWQLIRE